MMVSCWRLVGARGCTHSSARQILDWPVSRNLKIDDLITHR
jgi:hypothetical protein